MKNIIREVIFWGVYFVVPLLIKIIIFLAEWCISNLEYLKRNGEKKELGFYPIITVIITVGNCEDTLRACIESILNQNYPLNRMQILLMDNGSVDGSKDIFYEMQMEHPKLRMWWIESSKSKANSVNKGIYMAEGKYIINIDSSGVMGDNLIKNFVYRFENSPKVSALSAAVITNPEEAQNTRGFITRILQECEFFDLSQFFLVEEKVKARAGVMFSLSEHCSAFRKDILLKTQLYNGKTMNENIHMASQIKDFLGGTIDLAEDCFFYIKPIKSLKDLRRKRRELKRGEMEVSKLFDHPNKRKFNYVLNFSMLKYHTMIFAELSYFFTAVYVLCVEDVSPTIGIMIAALYVMDIQISLISRLIIKKIVKDQDKVRIHMKRNLWIVAIIPIYKLIDHIFILSGIINSSINYEEI